MQNKLWSLTLALTATASWAAPANTMTSDTGFWFWFDEYADQQGHVMDPLDLNELSQWDSPSPTPDSDSSSLTDSSSSKKIIEHVAEEKSL